MRLILILTTMSCILSSCISVSWPRSYRGADISGASLSGWTTTSQAGKDAPSPPQNASGVWFPENTSTRLDKSGSTSIDTKNDAQTWIEVSGETQSEVLSHGFSLQKTKMRYSLLFSWAVVRVFNPPYNGETLTEDFDPELPYFQSIKIIPTSENRFYLIRSWEWGDTSTVFLFDAVNKKLFDAYDLWDVTSIDIVYENEWTRFTVRWPYEACPEWGIYFLSRDGKFTRENPSCGTIYGGE